MKIVGSAHCGISKNACYLVRYNKNLLFVLILGFICMIKFCRLATQCTNARIAHFSSLKTTTQRCTAVNLFVNYMLQLLMDLKVRAMFLSFENI